MSVEYHDRPNTVNVDEDQRSVENVDQPNVVEVIDNGTTVTVVASVGAIGPQGPEGPQGPQGVPGAVQSITASSPLSVVGSLSPNLSLSGIVGVANGGTGASSLTGYVKGSGTSAFTASATIPNTDITGLGTLSVQNADAVAITGGYLADVSEEVTCKNRTGSPIGIGKAVYLLGAHGDMPEIALADASTETTAARTLGITAEAIAQNGTGRVCFSGLLEGINTNALTEGALVWLSETAGELTTTRPTQPAHGVFLGLCVKQAPGGAGILFVSVVNGQELEELHDVLITSPTAGQLFKRNAGNTLWVNATPGALTKTDDTNVTLTLGGSPSAALVNDASLTLGWTGTLAASRLNANVVQSVTNDTNVTGSINTQNLTLGWTGQLGVARGGTGASTLTGYVKGNGVSAMTAASTIPSTDITGLGTMSTQNATSVTITGGTISGIADLAIADGGTGASTAQDAINALAGAVTSGQYLRGNGSNVVMSAIQAADVPTLNQNTTGTAAGLSQTLAVSSGGTGTTSLTGYLVGNGSSAFTAVSSIPGSAISGNITGNAANVTGTVAVGNGGTGATSLSGYLVGNGSSAFTAVSSIPGSAISGNIAGNAANVTGLVAVTNGGTGVGSLTGLVKGNGTSAFTAATSGVDYAPATSGTAILYGDGAGGFSPVSIGSNLTFTGGTLSATGGGGSGTVTAVTASSPLASSGGTTPDISFAGTLSVGNGGTGATSLTGYLVGNGGSAFTAVSSIPGSAISGNIAGNAANVTGTVAVANGGSGATTLTGYLRGNGTSAFTASNSIPGSAISGNITGNAANVTGTVAVGNGGSGATTLTGYLRGNGTSAFTAVSSIPGSDISGNISGNAANVTGTVAVGNGGSGATTLTGYLRGNGTSAFTASNSIPGSAISGNITGNAANVTGTVAVGNGGTGVTTLTGLVKGNGASAFSAATSGTDYAPATSGSAILYGSGSGGFSAVSIGANLNFSGGVLSATGSVTATSIGWTAPYVATWSQTSSLSRTDGAMQVVVATSTLTVFLYAANSSSGHQVWVKNASTGTITLDADASETIDGTTTRTIPVQYGALQLVCDGTNWHIV